MTKIYKVLGKRGRVTIPHEIRRCIGFSYNDLLSFTVLEDTRTVVVKREKICDGCCISDSQKEPGVSLLDFLNQLTEEEQRSALFHLSEKLSRKQGGDGNA